VRSIVLRSPQTHRLDGEGMRRRQEALEQELRHGAAMVRAPAMLRAIDADACREALLRWRGQATVP